MRSSVLSSIGSFFFLLALLCVLTPSKISASPVALPVLNGLTERSAEAVASSETLDFSRLLEKRKGSKGGKSSGKKKGISKGAIIGIVIAVVIIIIIIAIILFLQKRKAAGH